MVQAVWAEFMNVSPKSLSRTVTELVPLPLTAAFGGSGPTTYMSFPHKRKGEGEQIAFTLGLWSQMVLRANRGFAVYLLYAFGQVA